MTVAISPKIPEPYNAHVFLVSPQTAIFGPTVTFKRERVIQPMEIRWQHYALGGSGAFWMTFEGTLTAAQKASAIQEEWEIILEIRLENETEYSTWYRGIIEKVDEKLIGQKTVSYVTGRGYWSKYGSRTQIDYDEQTGKDVGSLLSDLFTGAHPNVPTAQTRFVWDATKVTATGYTLGPYDTKGSLGRSVRVLSEVQGATEFDVDPVTRKFRLLASSSTVAERNMYQVGNNIDGLEHGVSNDREINRIVVTGHPRGGNTASTDRADATEQTADGSKMKNVLLPELSTTADMQRWADNKLADFKSHASWCIFKIADVRNRVEGTAPPIGKIRVWRQDGGQSTGGGAAGFTDYPLFKVEYQLGLKCAGELETPECTPDEVKKPGSGFKATVFCGAVPLSLPEILEQTAVEQEAVRHWVSRQVVPIDYVAAESITADLDRRWTGKLAKDTSGGAGEEILYMADSTANHVWHKVGSAHLAEDNVDNVFTVAQTIQGNLTLGVADISAGRLIIHTGSTDTTDAPLIFNTIGSGSELRMGCRYGAADNGWIDGTGALILNPTGGNVGIRTTSPAGFSGNADTLIHVSGSSAIKAGQVVISNSDNTYWMGLFGGISGDPTSIRWDSASDFVFATMTSLGAGLAEKVRITSAGNISLAASGAIIDLSDASTLGINTTTNRPITTGTGLFTLGGSLSVSGAAITLVGNSTVIDMTGSGTLSINTVTNRAITTGTGLFTMGGPGVVNGNWEVLGGDIFLDAGHYIDLNGLLITDATGNLDFSGATTGYSFDNFIDLSAIATTAKILKFSSSTSTKTTTWNASSSTTLPSQGPSVFMEVAVGAISYFVPAWA
jgi:hypothetical protein